MKRSLWCALLMICPLTLLGCSLWTVRGDGGQIQEATLPELLEGLSQRTDQLKDLKALISIGVGGKSTIKMRLVWRSPEEIHLMGFDPFGATLFNLNVDHNGVDWSSLGNPPLYSKSIETLDPTISSLQTGFPVTIKEMFDLTRVFTGPVVSKGEMPLLETKDRYYIISMVRMDEERVRLTKRFWIDRRGLRLTRQDFFREGGSQGIMLEFEDYRATGHGAWPYYMKIHLPDEGVSLYLAIEELILLPESPPRPLQSSLISSSSLCPRKPSRHQGTCFQVGARENQGLLEVEP